LHANFHDQAWAMFLTALIGPSETGRDRRGRSVSASLHRDVAQLPLGDGRNWRVLLLPRIVMDFRARDSAT